MILPEEKHEEKNPEVKTDAYYEIRISELQRQLREAQEELKTVNDELTLIRKNDVDKLIEEISGISTFTEDELKDKSREELLLIRAAIDKAPSTRRGIQPGASNTESQTSGLTAGKWDSAKQEWVL
jgi:stage III sporulation protein SpoIIIAA